MKAKNLNHRPAIIYVSGPITTGGNVPVNVRAGIEAAIVLMDKGYVVICPHEKAFGMEMLSPRSYEAWMTYDFKCIQACDAVYRMSDWRGHPLPSAGGDREVDYARSVGKPVYYSFDTLVAGLPTSIELYPLYQVDVGNGACPGFLPPGQLPSVDDDGPDCKVEEIEG
jgi:hypothetical protein